MNKKIILKGKDNISIVKVEKNKVYLPNMFNYKVYSVFENKIDALEYTGEYYWYAGEIDGLIVVDDDYSIISKGGENIDWTNVRMQLLKMLNFKKEDKTKKESLKEVIAEVREKPAAEVMAEIREEPAAEVMAEIREEPAAEVMAEIREEPAAEVMAEIREEPAAEVMAEIKEEPATEVMAEIREDPAIEVMTEDPVAQVMAETQEKLAERPMREFRYDYDRDHREEFRDDYDRGHREEFRDDMPRDFRKDFRDDRDRVFREEFRDAMYRGPRGEFKDDSYRGLKEDFEPSVRTMSDTINKNQTEGKIQENSAAEETENDAGDMGKFFNTHVSESDDKITAKVIGIKDLINEKGEIVTPFDGVYGSYKWKRIDRINNHLLVGQKDQIIVLGIPGVFALTPPKYLYGFNEFVYSFNGKGYWLKFINLREV